MHDVQSPRTDDSAIEQELAAKSKAPRVTLADIEANIVEEHCFTGLEGVRGSIPMPEPGKVHAVMVHASMRLLTLCVLVLRNGFTVVGKSACASPENFDADIGRKVARGDAINQCWALMGYQLRQELFEDRIDSAIATERLKEFMAEVKPVESTFLGRLRAEHAELRERLTKLQAFLASDKPASVPVAQVELMQEQVQHMHSLEGVLRHRLELIDAAGRSAVYGGA